VYSMYFMEILFDNLGSECYLLYIIYISDNVNFVFEVWWIIFYSGLWENILNIYWDK